MSILMPVQHCLDYFLFHSLLIFKISEGESYLFNAEFSLTFPDTYKLGF